MTCDQQFVSHDIPHESTQDHVVVRFSSRGTWSVGDSWMHAADTRWRQRTHPLHPAEELRSDAGEWSWVQETLVVNVIGHILGVHP